MSPGIFFQLSDTGKLLILYSEGIFIRERGDEVYTIQLFIMDNNYYEVWRVNVNSRLVHISLIDSENAQRLYPGKCEKEILRNKRWH